MNKCVIVTVFNCLRGLGTVIYRSVFEVELISSWFASRKTVKRQQGPRKLEACGPRTHNGGDSGLKNTGGT